MTLKRAPDYLVDEDSDDYGAVSSEDELQEEDPLLGDELLREEDESEDDFEKEMDMEIRQHMSISLPVSVCFSNNFNLGQRNAFDVFSIAKIPT